MIVGFAYTKIDIEKTAKPQGKIKVNNGLDIVSAKKHQLGIQDKKEAVTFSFRFTVNYEPKIGNIMIAGEVTYLADQVKLKNILDLWNKTKKLPPDVSTEIINIILAKCNIRALELAQDLNLPSHLPLPSINPQAEDPRQYIG